MVYFWDRINWQLQNARIFHLGAEGQGNSEKIRKERATSTQQRLGEFLVNGNDKLFRIARRMFIRRSHETASGNQLIISIGGGVNYDFLL